MNENVRVAVEETALYATPDKSGAIVNSVRWMENLPVDGEQMKTAPAGWIAISGTQGKKAARGMGARPPAWIQRSDVVFAGDYKKVVACWPVKSLTYAAGDYTAEVSFKLDGSASIKEWGDDPSFSKLSPRQAHVYMARNIVLLKAEK